MQKKFKWSNFIVALLLVAIGGGCFYYLYLIPPAYSPSSIEKEPATQGFPIPGRAKDAAGVVKGNSTSLYGYHVVRAFYGTDRKEVVGAGVKDRFGNERGRVSYGTVDVSIPKSHLPGVLEEPSIFRFEFAEKPEKHVVLLNIQKEDRESYFNQVASRVRSSASKRAFIFVHGYNVSFEDAARRTAQISYDLAFDGAPVFYSWPSSGSVPAYTRDEQNVAWSQYNLPGFLADFFSRSEAENIYLIAHSMGSRSLTSAVVELLEQNPEYKDRLSEVILAAPDIDAEIFKTHIAPALAQKVESVTLYASSDDKALKLSRGVHGAPRAGSSGEDLVVVDGVETIDATGIDTSFLGHSYFAETRTVLIDLYYLMLKRLRASERSTLVEVSGPGGGKYWDFSEGVFVTDEMYWIEED